MKRVIWAAMIVLGAGLFFLSLQSVLEDANKNSAERATLLAQGEPGIATVTGKKTEEVETADGWSTIHFLEVAHELDGRRFERRIRIQTLSGGGIEYSSIQVGQNIEIIFSKDRPGDFIAPKLETAPIAVLDLWLYRGISFVGAVAFAVLFFLKVIRSDSSRRR